MLLKIGFDTETDLITEDAPIPEMVCGAFAFEDQAIVTLQALECIQDLIAGDCEFTGVNIAYDWQVMVRAGLPIDKVFELYESERVRDSGLDWFLDDIAEGRSTNHSYSLESAAKWWLGVEVDKGEDTFRLRYGELKGVPIAQWPVPAYTYARDDGVQSLALGNKIPESPDSRRQAAWAWWKALSGTQGVRTDPARVERLRRKTIVEVADLASRLPDGWISLTRGGEITKHEKTIQNYVAAKFPGHPRTKPSKTHPQGQISLGYEDLQDSEDQALKDFAELKSKLSILSNDMKFLSRPRVRTRYGIAETGRSTSSGGKNSPDWMTNLQNIKKDGGIRECLVPDEGHVFLDADYDGLELCTIAQVCYTLLGKSSLGDMLKTGKDPHTVIAADLLEQTYDVAILRKSNPEDDQFQDARQCGKIGNFGLWGGAGVEALRRFARSNYGVRMTPDKAAQIKAAWQRNNPENKDYLWLGNNGDVTQLFTGRKRYRCSYTESNNTKFQGLGGDITQAAGFQIAYACYVDRNSPLYGCRISMFIHDQFVLTCPRAQAIEAAKELKRLMTTGMPAVLCPDVPLKTAPIITARLSKKAKSVVVDGQTIPWDDHWKYDAETGIWIDTRAVA